MVDPLEAVADAIMKYEGWYPGSSSYRHRNPGNLRSSPAMIKMDRGFAVFPGLAVGYRALLDDLRAKFLGHTAAKDADGNDIGPKSTVLQLFQAYAPAADHNRPVAYAAFVSSWTTKALGVTITPDSKLKEIWSPSR